MRFEDIVFDNNQEKRIGQILSSIGLTFVDGGQDCKLYDDRSELIGQLDLIYRCGDSDYIIVECTEKSKNTKKKEITAEKGSKFFILGQVSHIRKKLNLGTNDNLFFLLIGENVEGISSKLSSFTNENTKCKIWTDIEVEFYTKLGKILGNYGINFLKKELGILPPISEEKSVKCIRAKVGNRYAYIFATSVQDLLKMCYAYTLQQFQENGGYQRLLDEKKIDKINRYLEAPKRFFPNSIIINFDNNVNLVSQADTNRSGITFQTSDAKDATVAHGTLIFCPFRHLSAQVIDGQHRLYGYAKLAREKLDTAYLFVTAFDDLTQEEKSRMFTTINRTQTSLNKGLIDFLLSETSYDSDEDEFEHSQISRLVKMLNKENDSIIRERINFGVKTIKETYFTSRDIIEGLKHTNLIIGEKHYLIKDKNLKSAYATINQILKDTREKFSQEWNREIKRPQSIIRSNRGLWVIFHLLDCFYRSKESGKIGKDKTFKQLLDGINITESDFDELRKSVGSTGKSEILQKFLDEAAKVSGFESIKEA